MKNVNNKEDILNSLEVAFSLCDRRSINGFSLEREGIKVKDVVSKFGIPKTSLTDSLRERTVCRIHYGNEFCENLLPSPNELNLMLEETKVAGMDLSLVTPLSTDRCLKQLKRLFHQLPPDCEIIVNDWGVLRLIREEYPSLITVAGRQLCKMIKDPRLPSFQWPRAAPPFFSTGFLSVLEKYNINRIELDVPPYAEPTDFKINGMNSSVHAPYGFALKSRVCRIGSLYMNKDKKFFSGHVCKKECLTYICKMERSDVWKESDLHSFERGNTMFYRHSHEMTDTLFKAVDCGLVNRIIFAGDWNENSRANQQY